AYAAPLALRRTSGLTPRRSPCVAPAGLRRAARQLASSLPRLLAALINRQIAVLHRQRQDGHGGPVVWPLAVDPDPGAVAALIAEQDLVELGTEIAPVIVPQLEGCLRTVVHAVKEVVVVPAGRVLEQIGAGLDRFGRMVASLAANLQPEDPGAGAGDS